MYQITFGQITMRSEAMLAGFRKMGGDHKIIEMSPERAAISLNRPGGDNWLDFQLNHLEVKQEVFYDKNPKYKTPFSRQQMLWARVVSMAIRALAPEVNSGLYTPEESQDIHLEEGGPLVEPDDSELVPAPYVETEPKYYPGGLRPDEVVEVATEIANEKLAELVMDEVETVPAPATADDVVAEYMSTTEQQNLIEKLLVHCFPGEAAQALANACENRGHTNLVDFTHAEAHEFISKLTTEAANQSEDDVPF